MKQSIFMKSVTIALGLLLLAPAAFGQTITTSQTQPLTVAATGKLEVTVYNTENGNTAAGAGVVVYTRGGEVGAKGETNASGVYTAEVVVGEYIVVVNNQVRQEVTITAGQTTYAKLSVRTRTPEPPTTLPNPMVALMHIYVQDALTGAPIAKAHVNVLVRSEKEEGFSVANGFTDEKGLFEARVKPNIKGVIVATAPSYHPKKTDLNVGEGGKMQIELVPNKKICREDYQRFKKGDTNEDVRELQKKLRESGDLRSDVTGYYGRLTEEARERAEREGRLVNCYTPPTNPPQPTPPPVSSDVKAELSRIAKLLEEVTRALNALLERLGR